MTQMTENEVFETLTRFDANAVDHFGAAIDILKAQNVSFESACRLLQAVYANQEV